MLRWLDSCWANCTRLQLCGKTGVETAVSWPLLCIVCSASGMIWVRRDEKYTGLVSKLRVGLHFYGGGRLSVSCMEWQLHVLPFFIPFVVACRWCICISLSSPERAYPRTVTFTTRYIASVKRMNECTYAIMETDVAIDALGGWWVHLDMKLLLYSCCGAIWYLACLGARATCWPFLQ